MHYTSANKLYYWKAIDEKQSTCFGYDYAPNKSILRHQLYHQDVSSIKIRRIFLCYRPKLSQKHVYAILSNTQQLLESGISLIDALNIQLNSTKQPAAYLFIQHIAKEITSGKAFSQAIQQHSKHFPAMILQLIRAGEYSGKLNQSLQHAAKLIDKQLSFKKNLVNSLFYPTTLLATAITVIMIMSNVMIPSFESLFHHLNGELPLLTKIVMKVSHHISQAVMYFPAIALLTAVMGNHCFHKIARFRLFIEKTILNMPLIGQCLKKVEFYRYCLSMSITLSSGIPISESLELAKLMFYVKLHQDRARIISKLVVKGNKLSQTMSLQQFPPQIVNLIVIAEQTGQLDIAFTNLANYFEQQTQEKLSRMKQFIEFFILGLLGVTIGCVVMAMYLPILNIGLLI